MYDRDYGFDIRFPYTRGADYWLLIRCDGKTARIKFNEELIAKRQEARKNKDFKTADAIRDQLADMGIVLKDTPQGVQWSRK